MNERTHLHRQVTRPRRRQSGRRLRFRCPEKRREPTACLYRRTGSRRYGNRCNNNFIKIEIFVGNFQCNVRVEGDADVGIFGVDFAERQFRRFRPQVERSLDLLADQRFVQVLCAFANAEIMKNLNFKQIEIEEFVIT